MPRSPLMRMRLRSSGSTRGSLGEKRGPGPTREGALGFDAHRSPGPRCQRVRLGDATIREGSPARASHGRRKDIVQGAQDTPPSTARRDGAPRRGTSPRGAAGRSGPRTGACGPRQAGSHAYGPIRAISGSPGPDPDGTIQACTRSPPPASSTQAPPLTPQGYSSSASAADPPVAATSSRSASEPRVWRQARDRSRRGPRPPRPAPPRRADRARARLANAGFPLDSRGPARASGPRRPHRSRMRWPPGSGSTPPVRLTTGHGRKGPQQRTARTPFNALRGAQGLLPSERTGGRGSPGHQAPHVLVPYQGRLAKPLRSVPIPHPCT